MKIKPLQFVKQPLKDEHGREVWEAVTAVGAYQVVGKQQFKLPASVVSFAPSMGDSTIRVIFSSQESIDGAFAAATAHYEDLVNTIVDQCLETEDHQVVNVPIDKLLPIYKSGTPSSQYDYIRIVRHNCDRFSGFAAAVKRGGCRDNSTAWADAGHGNTPMEALINLYEVASGKVQPPPSKNFLL
jgi:hypothetical protein